ncbi:hypothetical protein Tco_0025549 [Tanacetum coccineum]
MGGTESLVKGRTWNNVQRVNKQNQFVPSAVVNTARASGTKNLVLLGEKGKLLLSPQQVVIGDHKDTTGTISPNKMVDPVLEIIIHIELSKE